MAYRFHVDESVEEGVRRIAREQLDGALAALDGSDPDEAIHGVRKRGKKLRALLRLVRPAFGARYAAENARLRDAARPLSAVRDAAALVGAYDALLGHFRGEVRRRPFAPVRRALVRRRRARAADVPALLEALRADLLAARSSAAGWALAAEGFDALGEGLEDTYRLGQRALRAACRAPDDARLHAWRKRVKDHWYHARLLRDVWPPAVQARRREARRLAVLLGDDRDLAVLAGLLRGAPGAYGGPGAYGDERALQALLGLLERRRAELQARARHLGARLYAERAGAFADRYGVYWDAWHAEAEVAAPLAPPPAAASEA